MTSMDDPIQIDANFGEDYADVELRLDPTTIALDVSLGQTELVTVEDVTVTVDAHVGIPGVPGPTGPAGALSKETLAANPDMIIAGTIVRDGNGAAISAPVIWPDGETGTYTGIPSVDFPGAVDSYTVTSETEAYTQPPVTRDARGAVIFRPPMETTVI